MSSPIRKMPTISMPTFAIRKLPMAEIAQVDQRLALPRSITDESDGRDDATAREASVIGLLQPCPGRG